MKGNTMSPLSIRATLLAGIAAAAMTVPAAASLTTSASTHSAPAQAQYAQCTISGCNPGGSAAVDYGYKSTKSKKSKTSKKPKTGTTGQAKSTK